MDFSIIATLYQSSPFIEAFVKRIKRTVEKISQNYEIILVNDGSPDDSLEIAKKIQENDSKVKLIDLSRNFGHHRAMMTGLSYAQGKLVFLIDSDLEEEPEILEAFHSTLIEKKVDVVYGIQPKRKGGVFERLSGWFFYTFFNLISPTKIIPNALTARLMTQRYVKNLLKYKEREFFIPGLWKLTGFEQMGFQVIKKSKKTSSYSFSKKIHLLVNAITAFTNRPLTFIFYTGLAICLFSLLYILRLIYLKVFLGIPVLGWASIFVSIWFLGGLTILFIGIIGIYLSKVFTETKQRPYAIVRETFPSSLMEQSNSLIGNDSK